MSHHDAYGMKFADLDVAIVESNRVMQKTLRSMLAAFGLRRMRGYDTASEALSAMLPDPPSVVIAAWQLSGMNGEQLMRIMRDPEFPSLCRVPVIIVTGRTTLSVVDRAFSSGCTSLLSKPLSTAMLRSRLEWLVRDPRQMIEEDGRMVVAGMEAILETRVRNSPLAKAIERASALEAVVRDATGQPPELDEPAQQPARHWHGWNMHPERDWTAA